MTPEQQYVQQATRGLHGQARRDTQAELLDHLTARACQLVLGGLSPEQARTQAMQELGAPTTIARSLRREQGFATFSRFAAGMVIAMTLLTSLTANLYARDYKPVTSAVDRVLFPPRHTDPCQNRTHCVTVAADAHLGLPDTLIYGLLPFNQADTYLAGTGLHVRGLLRKSLNLDGYPAVRIDPYRIGRAGQPGTQGGYFSVSATLVDAARQGWPVQLQRSSGSYKVVVAGRPINPVGRLAQTQALSVASLALEDLLDQRFAAAVRAAARVAPENTWWHPYAWAVHPGHTPHGNGVTLTAPGKDRMFAAILFEPERHPRPNTTYESSLTAVLIPNDSGKLTVPITPTEEGPGQLRLVHSREHFLKAVRNGERTALLLRFPGTLPVPLDVVPVQERLIDVTRL